MNISGGRRRGQERGSRSERFSDKSSFHRPWPQRRSGGQGKRTALLRDVLEADRKPDGDLRQDNVFRYVVATKE
jgi:hypothetical protein